MEDFFQDIRYGFRMLRKSPGFAAVAVLTLALGIGANTAIFTVINAVLIRPLPYSEADRLVLLWGRSDDDDRSQVSATDVEDFRRHTGSFVDISTFSDWTPMVTGIAEPQRVPGIQVGEAYFRIMGVEPLLGRTFVPEEQIEGRDRVIVLGYEMWQRMFSGDPAIVGKTVRMSNQPYVIVGVMPQHFRALPQTLVGPGRFYRPVAEAYDESQRSSRHLRAIARLKPDVSLSQAQAEVDSISQRLAELHPDDHGAYRIRLATLPDDTFGNIRGTLFLLFAAVGCVLLIACANVANLLLARSTARQREIAVRAALGASSSRILRQFLTEAVLLSLTASFVSLLLAAWTTTLLGAVGASTLPQLLVNPLQVDRQVLLFTFVVSILTGLIFGAAPALHASRFDLQDVLKGTGGWSSTGRSHARSSLLVFQVAASLVLLVAAGLILRSFAVVRAIDPGFESTDRVVMNVWLPFAKYGEPAKTLAFYREFLDRLHSSPDVKAAGLVSTLPFRGFDTRGVDVDGQSFPPGAKPDPDTYFVSPDYLRAMGVAVVKGRALSDADHENAAPVALVNETMAQQLWPEQDPIGKRVSICTSGDCRVRWREVVGVVRDIRHYSLEQPARMQLYIPHTQFTSTAMVLVVHARNTAPVIAAVRHHIRVMDPDVAPFEISTMDQLISESVAIRRFSMALITTFAVLAAIVAAVGIYGVIAFWAAQRTREMGIRIALGARRADIIGLVLGHGLRLCGLGIAIGVPGALLAGQALRSFLFGVSPADMFTISAVALAFGAVALLASFLPAHRATQVDPMVALRYE